MGWCHEFGIQICEGCGGPMEPGEQSCRCDECQTECFGKFAGCPAVWERGPQPAVHVDPILGRRLSFERRTMLPVLPPEVAAEPERTDEPAAAAASAPAVVGNGHGVARIDDSIARLEQIAASLAASLAQVASAMAELRAETQRVASVGQVAHASLAVARQIERTTARVDQRLDELAQGLDTFRRRLDEPIDHPAVGLVSER